MNISRINSYHNKLISFKNCSQQQKSNNVVNKTSNEKNKYTTKEIIKYCVAGAVALFSIPVIFMAFDGKLKGFGKLYKEEVKQIFECL